MKNIVFDKYTEEWFERELGEPTKVQQEAWPAIASGQDVLVSAPTGTGKTLSAFLVFIDRFLHEAREKKYLQQLMSNEGSSEAESEASSDQKKRKSITEEKNELQLIYISPLKSLAADIRENLKRPINGILRTQLEADASVRNAAGDLKVAIRTGDTTTAERRSMTKNPPHILITTPESLYLLLTSASGKEMLRTVKSIIIDELHAVIDTKRGAHLMLSLARLDRLCGRKLQRIGLSATIEPLPLAAKYLSPMRDAVIVAPHMNKAISIHVTSPREHENVIVGSNRWKELADAVYEHCKGARTVIAFVDGRMYAEKLAYYVNQIAGEGFARTHHGSMSKEQRQEVERALREGEVHLLCATATMELGIDVGDVDRVFQVGCPPTISGTLQRLGRAGHNPGRVSEMHIFPRSATEGFYCGLTAKLVSEGKIEQLCPPHLCLDILAQHLVSMAAGESYHVEEIEELLKDSYPFRDVTRTDIEAVLCMLAGDYEHDSDIPVRPRLLYDRIHGSVEGDNYSRMLAVSAGGTIPDTGMYAVKTVNGVKLGELDEEFVFEAHIGDKFMLGTFAWRILSVKKDAVVVEQTSMAGASLPFWKGSPRGRKLRTGYEFGAIMRGFQNLTTEEEIKEELMRLGLDEVSAKKSGDFLLRQKKATGGLPDDRTMILEHFHDETGNYQLMVHSVYGRPVNGPLAILMKEMAERIMKTNVSFVEDDDGFLIYPYGEEDLPDGLLQRIMPESAREMLTAVLPATPVFNITFRYNAAHALMTGIKKAGRQPLWVQRMRSAQMMDTLLKYKEHPLIRETTRECLEECWDIPGLVEVLNKIRTGEIVIKELHQEAPSPMTLGLRRQAEAIMTYDYTPTPMHVHIKAGQEMKVARERGIQKMLQPDAAQLEKVGERNRLPENEKELHSLLMMEGDLIAGELDVPVSWLEELIKQQRVCFIEPGLWIAAEQREDYEIALVNNSNEDIITDEDNKLELQKKIVRRVLRYRGAQTASSIAERYLWSTDKVDHVLHELLVDMDAVCDNGLYYHAKLYDKARWETIKERRQMNVTYPVMNYAALLAGRDMSATDAKSRLEYLMGQLKGQLIDLKTMEELVFPSRLPNYRAEYLDALVSEGKLIWRYHEKGLISFHDYSEIDWDEEADRKEETDKKEEAEGKQETESDEKTLNEEESIIYNALLKRGASFMQSLNSLLSGASPHNTLLSLVQKGYVTADSLLPVRQLERMSDKKAGKRSEKEQLRATINARVQALNTGRFEAARALKPIPTEQLLDHIFDSQIIVSRETVNAYAENRTEGYQISWVQALEVLRVWEYTGRVRRGYFVEGLSGIQFIRDSEFSEVSALLAKPVTSRRCLAAVDPILPWGRTLMHMSDRAYLNIAGTVVCLADGVPVAVFERMGKAFRVFDEEAAALIMDEFVKKYKSRQIYSTQIRIVVKDYDETAERLLKAAGFYKEITDYVIYR